MSTETDKSTAIRGVLMSGFKRQRFAVFTPWILLLPMLSGVAVVAIGLEHLPVLLVPVGTLISALGVYLFGRSLILGVRVVDGVVEHISWFVTTRVSVGLIDRVEAQRRVLLTCPVAILHDREFPLTALGTLIPAGQRRLAASLSEEVLRESGSAREAPLIRRRVFPLPWRSVAP